MNQALQAVIAKYDIAPCHTPTPILSGIPALDAVTGGVPKGRIVDIYGTDDAGKTTLTLALAKGNTLFLDAECKLTSSMVGERHELFYIMHPEALEDALNICRTAGAGFDSIVVDSLEALPLKAELDRPFTEFFLETGNETTRERERVLSYALPILSQVLLANGCTLIVVNQVRDRQMVMYGDPEYSTGGHALPYYASVRLRVGREGFIKRGKETEGHTLKIRVVKHKYHAPGGTATLDLDYSTGRLTSRRRPKPVKRVGIENL